VSTFGLSFPFTEHVSTPSQPKAIDEGSSAVETEIGQTENFSTTTRSGEPLFDRIT